MTTNRARQLVYGSLLVGVWLVAGTMQMRVGGQEESAPRPQPAAPAASAVAGDPTIDSLYRDVARAQALRDVKYLQVTYQQYAQFGMWDEMAALFADKAEATFGTDVMNGREAIARYLLTTYGEGKIGLPAGGLHNEILIGPVVTLGYDGMSANARWSKVVMLGGQGGAARWEGGLEENEYVVEDGRWKIARLHYYRQFAGPYETGWFSTAPTLPIIPAHYTPSTAGRPVPEVPGDIPKIRSPMTLPEIELWIQALSDEDQVRNLQNIYGYYIDRKMWDDVTDLFTSDGIFEVAGIGVYEGTKSIRRALERDGPVGLQNGQVHDHLQLTTTVTVERGGNEARARGLQLGMLTPKLGEAYWSVGTFVNRYVKRDGVWMIRESRVFPKMKSDYYQGWGKSAIAEAAPDASHAPDKPTPSSDSVDGGLAVPVFFQVNPSTGQPVKYPAGRRVVGQERLAAALATVPPVAAPSVTAANLPARLTEARRKLGIVKGYDAIENISNSLSYYMDDELWQEWADTMSAQGWRVQGGGWFVGRERLYLAMTQGHTTPPSRTTPREAIRIHQRAQPVIDVSPNGKSAKIRTRMWLYFASPTAAGAWNSGMYPNDAAVLEEGVWRVDVNLIDETYFSSSSYADGWARPAARGQGAGPGAAGRGPGAGGAAAGAAGPGRARGAGAAPAGPGGASSRGNTVFGSGIEIAPDIPASVMNEFRRKNFGVSYPEIKPMWFHYRNPVSGRAPQFYCPDVKTCYKP